MIKSIIVAKSENNVIGKDNDLVWHLPKDQKYFKNTTMGHYVVMGRKTYESMNKPLPGRLNIIITRKQDYFVEGCVVFRDLAEAIDFAETNGQQELFILGGGEIYKQSIDFVDKLYITEVKDVFDGDTYFPEFDRKLWKEISKESHQADEHHDVPFDIIQYVRKR